jgi:FkbM family methyltransferase
MSHPTTLSLAELQHLAADRPERTTELFTPNDFYGHASILKRYCGLPGSFAINGILPHGPYLSSKLWDLELQHAVPNLLVLSEQQRELYARQTSKTIQVIGSPLYYAARLIEPELQELRRQAAGTVVFPTHSTHHVTAQFDEARFIGMLKELPAEFQPVQVCLYWRDVQLGRHQPYLDADFACTTAGHMFDHEFLFRLLRILAGHRFALANKLGTAPFYSAAMGLPVLLKLQEASYQGPNPQFMAELTSAVDLPAAVKFRETAALPLDQAAPRQRALAEETLGRVAVKEPAQLRALLEGLAPRPSRPSKPRAATPALQGSMETILKMLQPTLSNQPRRVPGQLQLDGRPFRYVDLHSFFHQADQIFRGRLYDFTPATDRPLILDCGAHIGLAALYFARRYPQAEIHSFEADPAIAKVLAGNVRSLGLAQVTVHPEAVWIDAAGVTFDSSGDDSGHVRAGAGTTVPSMRLRAFLQERTVDLLKLDIEGAEYRVLADCDGVLANARNVVLEVHHFRDGDGRLGELLGVLERNHFQYTLGDLHAAEWIASAFKPPFAACKTPHYIVTIFAWQKSPGAAPCSVAPAAALESRLREAVECLNARRDSEALSLMDQILAAQPEFCRLHYGRAIALARLDRVPEARAALERLPVRERCAGKARLLLEELETRG